MDVVLSGPAVAFDVNVAVVVMMLVMQLFLSLTLLMLLLQSFHALPLNNILKIRLLLLF